MKKIFGKSILLIALSILSIDVFAQQYRSFTLDNAPFGTNGIYYSLPQTELVFDVCIEKITEYKGCYADYAYLLGLKNIILSDEVSYRIKDIKIRTKTIADNSSTYFLQYEDGVCVQLNDAGCLSAIGKVPPQQMMPPCEKKHHARAAKQKPAAETKSTLPTYEQRYLEAGMLESLPGMTADKAVKQIERLKEKQIDILSGSIDGTYMNNTVEYMYKQLDEMIEAYVAMFAGSRQSEELHYTFTIIPEKPLIVEQDLLVGVFKFSEQEGVKPLNSPSDIPTIVANLHSFNTTKEQTKTEAQKSKDDKLQKRLAKKGVGVYYRIPEKVKVSITSVEKVFDKTVNISQFGQTTCIMDCPSGLLFDPESGALKHIAK